MLTRRKRRRTRPRPFSSYNPFRRFRKRAASAETAALEALEPRMLFTTLIGGDVFEYIDAQGTTVRVATAGNLIVELIAGDIDDQNNVIFGDLPGTFLNSQIGRANADVLGGRGGADGVIPVTLNDAGGAPTPVTDPATGITIGVPIGGQELINISAIASRAALDGGETYGFNRGTIPLTAGERDTVQLVRFDTPDYDQFGGGADGRHQPRGGARSGPSQD